jgi:RNA polymerase sigma-70 factor (ECF subfamily)
MTSARAASAKVARKTPDPGWVIVYGPNTPTLPREQTPTKNTHPKPSCTILTNGSLNLSLRLKLHDSEFLPALHRGDNAAFELLYRHYSESLTYFVDQLINDAAVAEDIAAETLAKLFRKNADFTTLEKIKGYLYITASNAAFDHLRKEKRHHRIHGEIAYLTDAETEDVEFAYIRAEASRAVQEAINALPEKPREVIRMAFIEGKKLAEIAEALNLSYNTVQNYRGKGLELMRIQLVKNKLLTPLMLGIALSLLEKH